MAKIKALLTTLVLGTSSIAMAQPAPSFDRYDRDDRWDRDDRYDRDDRWDRDDRYDRDRADAPRRYRSSWVSLAEPLQLVRGRDTIDVRVRGTFTQLRLQTVAGATYIDRVIVQFRDGSRQIAEINQAVTPHNRMIEILLDGNNRHVERVSVIGRSQRNAAIQVFGI